VVNVVVQEALYWVYDKGVGEDEVMIIMIKSTQRLGWIDIDKITMDIDEDTVQDRIIKANEHLGGNATIIRDYDFMKDDEKYHRFELKSEDGHKRVVLLFYYGFV